MSELFIKSMQIDDSLDQPAQTATVTLTPPERVQADESETMNPFDSIGKLSVTDIRPTGDSITVEVAHGNVPNHVAFTGYVDFVDDSTEPTGFNANIELSSLPIDREHKTKVTMLWTNISIPGTEDETITAYQILREACDAVGLPCGRLDFPNYQVVGTYEAEGKTVTEIANDLIEPFNHFEFFQYYVFTDETNGLEVIGIDFSGNDSAYGFLPQTIYEMANIKTFTRKYERYMPENQIGDLDVLLLGGDYLVPPADSTMFNGADPRDPGIPVANKENPAQPQQDSSFVYFVQETFITESNASEKETRTRNEKTFTMTVRTINFSVDNPSTLTDIADAFFGLVQVGSLASVYGALYNIEILDSKIQNETTFEYEGETLKQQTERNYIYEDVDFSKYAPSNLIIYSKATEEVLTQMDELTTIFIGGEYPLTLTKSFYYYDGFGQQYKTEQREYVCFPGQQFAGPQNPITGSRGPQWFLKKVNWTDSDSLDNLQNQIRMIAEAIRLRRSQPQSPRSDHPYGQTSNGASQQSFGTGDSGQSKQDLAQYQLVNGKPFKPEDVLSPYRDLSTIIDEYAKADPTAAFSQEELLKRNAFVLQCPHMTYKGLMVVWNMCIRQRAIERSRAYWERSSVTCLIDTNVASTSTVKAKGSVGVATGVTHNINANEATSTVAIRRLIVPGNQ